MTEYCVKCGTALPDGAQFCFKCGSATPAAAGGDAVGNAPAPPSGAGKSLGAAGIQELKCPSCGAPIKPSFGEMVITCDYCGGSVTLGGEGWKEINTHTMLPLKVMDANGALRAVHDFLDQGFFSRHAFEQSKITEQRLSYVPFWVMPASASTTYQYQAVAVSVGATVGTIAAGALLGDALGGNRGGFMMMPILAGPVVNPNRSETLSGQYEYPVVAVKAMTAYQPKDYQFGLSDRTLFDKKNIPAGTTILNGDLGEDAAKHTAEAYVQQLQSEAAHKKHSMVSQLKTQVDISDGELLHVPIWYFRLERNNETTTILIDGHAGRVIRTVT
jgi:hypothetical protein